MRKITAIEMAESKGIYPKRFRDALQKAQFQWHVHGEKWTVDENSPEHVAMKEVLKSLLKAKAR